MFSFKNFFFIPTLGMQTVTFPPHIKLEFHTHEGNIQSHELAQNIREVLISVMEDKLQLIERDTKHNDTKHNKIIKFLDKENGFFGKLIRLNQYLDSWSGMDMTFLEYLNRRGHHTNLFEQLRQRLKDFETNTSRQNEDAQQERIRYLVNQIELHEIRDIYGSDDILELSI
jgi:hypothetical protein